MTIHLRTFDKYGRASAACNRFGSAKGPLSPDGKKVTCNSCLHYSLSRLAEEGRVVK